WWSQAQKKLQQVLPPHVLLQTEFPSELPPIAISPHQLTLTVRNLVINSGESITGTSGVVRIGCRASDDQQNVFIGATDNGRGMTEEVRQHALELFFTTKNRTLSTGLGLC